MGKGGKNMELRKSGREKGMSFQTRFKSETRFILRPSFGRFWFPDFLIS
jgi:hypothetical protein